MEGVSAALYRRISPYLCAGRVGVAAKVNVNALEERHAPIIAAMTKGAWGASDIRAQIKARPPGGWSEAVNFWAPFVAAGGEPPGERGVLTPGEVEARIILSLGGRDMEETLLFSLSEGTPPRLALRVFGADR
jgi:general secretion pathway protein K